MSLEDNDGDALTSGGAHPRPVIAIDGPGGAGKSTIARRVAQRAGLVYIDTGAMYRAVAWAALRRGMAADPERIDAAAVSHLAETVCIAFERSGRDQRVLADGVDITAGLRTPEVDRLVPRVAEVPGVRRALVPQQRRLAASGGVVMDGRDVGTAVLPAADHKFFITAALPVRARRRYEDLRRRGERVSLEGVTESLQERDELDRRRAEGPLRRAGDAIVIDTSDLTVDEAVETVLRSCGGDAAHLQSVAPHAGGEDA